MSKIDRRLAELGVILPKPWTLPPGLVIPASLVRVRGKRVLISGHVPTNADGSVAGPFGRVGGEVSPEEGHVAARRALISIPLNGASSLIQEVFGPEIGEHARVAIGVGALPFNVPVEIEAEVELA